MCFFLAVLISDNPQQLVCWVPKTQSRWICLAVNVLWRCSPHCSIWLSPGLLFAQEKMEMQGECQKAGTQELSRNKMYRWPSPQGIVTLLWITAVWIMDPFHVTETRVDHTIHFMHLRLRWLIETCTLCPTLAHGTGETIQMAEQGWTTWAHIRSYLDTSHPGVSCSSRYLFTSHAPNLILTNVISACQVLGMRLVINSLCHSSWYG